MKKLFYLLFLMASLNVVNAKCTPEVERTLKTLYIYKAQLYKKHLKQSDQKKQ